MSPLLFAGCSLSFVLSHAWCALVVAAVVVVGCLSVVLGRCRLLVAVGRCRLWLVVVGCGEIFLVVVGWLDFLGLCNLVRSGGGGGGGDGCVVVAVAVAVGVGLLVVVVVVVVVVLCLFFFLFLIVVGHGWLLLVSGWIKLLFMRCDSVKLLCASVLSLAQFLGQDCVEG